MNRILVEAEELDPDGRAELRDARARHLREVLHAAVGSQYRAGVVDGPVGDLVVEVIHDARVRVRFEAGGDPPGAPAIDLVLALPRPKVLNRLWAQLAAIGVRRILLTGARRVERYYFDSHVLDPANYRPRLVEGLQQASDTRLPDVAVFRHLRAAVEQGLDGRDPKASRVVLHPGAEQRLIDHAPDNADGLILAVGPEGGWSDDEVSFLDRSGFDPRCLGGRILRSDTACIAALALAAARFESSRP